MPKTITLTEDQLQQMIKEAIANDKKIVHSLNQDQIDMLSIIAPGKLTRHDYEVVEPKA